ncbi:src-like-adapter 2 isoform X1 [Electrophorus electricus]|uniref:Src-like-adapter 2 n=1 Tax=Electrophorus electricus TaxID=8005 RepID=A0A4W4FGK1_ELEEL|nr:src-like-adapter 2 isoform X1 [Electrophorus electricus]
MGCWPSKGLYGSTLSSAILSQEEPVEPHSMDSGRYVVVALYDYPSGGPADCSIRVGERLNVLSDEGEWWRVSSSVTGRESYIPSNYTAKLYNRWQFVGLSREKAEELLRLPHNHPGSFLIRESNSEHGAHTLSVRKSSRPEHHSIKHYRIHRIENGWHYISPSLTFPTLTHLVEHYSEVSDGLCCVLREPCFIQGSNNVPVVSGPPPVALRKPTLNWKEVSSSVIFGPKKDGVEDTLVSEGLKESINSYLYMTEDCGECSENWDT